MPLCKGFWEQYGEVLKKPPNTRKTYRRKKTPIALEAERALRKSNAKLQVLKSLGVDLGDISLGDNLQGLRKTTAVQREPVEERRRVRNLTGDALAPERSLIKNPLYGKAGAVPAPVERTRAEIAHVKKLRDEVS